MYIKETRKEQANFKVSRRKKIIKITVEINKTETKRPIENINEMKSQFFVNKDKQN